MTNSQEDGKYGPLVWGQPQWCGKGNSRIQVKKKSVGMPQSRLSRKIKVGGNRCKQKGKMPKQVKIEQDIGQDVEWYDKLDNEERTAQRRLKALLQSCTEAVRATG